MSIELIEYIKNPVKKKALVFGTNLGAALLGKSPQIIYSDPKAQVEAILAFYEYYDADFLITAMDLTVEAECFGSKVRYSDFNAPTTENRFVVDISQIKNMNIPDIGEKRSQMHIDLTRKIISLHPSRPVLGGVIGPFTLASRLFGVAEMLELTIQNETSALMLIEKCYQFILNYAKAFKSIGSNGVILSEPSAGLLSPKALLKFSSFFIKNLIEEIESPIFRVIYHNCGAKAAHLEAIFESQVSILHFGEPMDISLALDRSQGKRIISGNLDPVAVFFSKDEKFVIKKTSELINKTRKYTNFLIAPGCDLPLRTPLGNITAFYSTLN